MIPVKTFDGKNVALFGLGLSGLATAKALIAGGATVAAYDDKEGAREKAAAEGIPIVDLKSADWTRFDALLQSPGVPLTHPKPHWTVEKAKAAGIEIIGDIELFCRERRRIAPDSTFVSITGTNGKSTTTALTGHLLASAGRDVAVGGNIGTAILTLPPPKVGRIHVIETTTYQIDLSPTIDPSIGVLLNFMEDHIDRHGTYANYMAIKERLIRASQHAVVGIDDDDTRRVAAALAAAGKPLTLFSKRGDADATYRAEGTRIVERNGGASHLIGALDGNISLRGVHNAQNAAAAVAVARLVGLSEAEIQASLKTFRGLAHRMEEVGRRGKVVFINDSKATNADATLVAVAAFNPIYIILGGRPKSNGIAGLDQFYSRIRKAYLIGEAAEDFANVLGDKVPHVIAGQLDKAFALAADDAERDAAPEPAVLLSPACASWDQFKNFEERGDRFRAMVHSLKGVVPTGVTR